jgi:hypothetical protein
MRNRFGNAAVLVAVLGACSPDIAARNSGDRFTGIQEPITSVDEQEKAQNTRVLVYRGYAEGAPNVAVLVQGIEFTFRACDPSQALPDMSSPSAVRSYVETSCTESLSEMDPKSDLNHYWVVNKFFVSATNRLIAGSGGAYAASDRTGVSAYAMSLSLSDPSTLVQGGNTMRTDQGLFKPFFSSDSYPLHGESYIGWRQLKKATIEVP